MRFSRKKFIFYPAPSTSYRAVDREIEAPTAIVWEAGEPSTKLFWETGEPTKIIHGGWGVPCPAEL